MILTIVSMQWYIRIQSKEGTDGQVYTSPIVFYLANIGSGPHTVIQRQSPWYNPASLTLVTTVHAMPYEATFMHPNGAVNESWLCMSGHPAIAATYQGEVTCMQGLGCTYQPMQHIAANKRGHLDITPYWGRAMIIPTSYPWNALVDWVGKEARWPMNGIKLCQYAELIMSLASSLRLTIIMQN